MPSWHTHGTVMQAESIAAKTGKEGVNNNSQFANAQPSTEAKKEQRNVVSQGSRPTNEIPNKKTDALDETFDLDDNYQIIEFLGAGAYGVVCAAQDLSNDRVVAVKKCKNIFQCRTLAKRTLREIKLLRYMDHDHIIKILTIMNPTDRENFNHLYVVFEIMDTDLAQVIRSPQKLKDQHIQYFTYQLVLGLKYIHSANIIHRDLK